MSATHEIIAELVVWFEETGEQRVVVRDCERCFSAAEAYGSGVVSPSGLAHIAEYETTLCGKDATGDGWWWRL